MANTLYITREHLDKDNYYIGPDVSNYDGDIVLEAGLGKVKFKNGVSASGSIIAKRGTGIIAKGSIEADGGIKADGNILSSESIEAGESIESGASVVAGTDIEAGDSIQAGWVILAGRNILAKHAIDADGSIEARGSIKSGKGIRAGLFIDCKTLSAGLPISAGTSTWTTPEKEQTQIRCEKLYGRVACGELILNGEVVA